MRILKDARIMADSSTYLGELIQESGGHLVLRLTNFRNGTVLAFDAHDAVHIRELLAMVI